LAALRGLVPNEREPTHSLSPRLAVFVRCNLRLRQSAWIKLGEKGAEGLRGQRLRHDETHHCRTMASTPKEPRSLPRTSPRSKSLTPCLQQDHLLAGTILRASQDRHVPQALPRRPDVSVWSTKRKPSIRSGGKSWGRCWEARAICSRTACFRDSPARYRARVTNSRCLPRLWY
jgi:hypothetical protein